jgi:hypothetical protein
MGPQGTRIPPRLVILLSQDKIGAMNPTTLSRIGTPTTVVSNVVAWVLTGDANRLYRMDASSNTIAGVSKAPASATPFTLPVALTSDPMLAAEAVTIAATACMRHRPDRVRSSASISTGLDLQPIRSSPPRARSTGIR